MRPGDRLRFRLCGRPAFCGAETRLPNRKTADDTRRTHRRAAPFVAGTRSGSESVASGARGAKTWNAAAAGSANRSAERVRQQFDGQGSAIFESIVGVAVRKYSNFSAAGNKGAVQS